MQYEGFVGGSYTSQSPNADAQRTMNWYLEKIESGEGKFRQALYPTPGLKVFSVPTAAQQVGISGVAVSRAGDTSDALTTLEVKDYDAVNPAIQTAATGTGGTGSVDYYSTPSIISAGAISRSGTGTVTNHFQLGAVAFPAVSVSGLNVTLKVALAFSLPDPPNAGYVSLDYSLDNGSTFINIGTWSANVAGGILNISYVVTGLTNLDTLGLRVTASASWSSLSGDPSASTNVSASSIHATVAGGGNWTNSFSGGNLYDSSITALAGVLTNQLLCSNFTDTGLPTGRTVTGVAVALHLTATVTTPSSNNWTLTIGLLYQGSPIGTAKTYSQSANASGLVLTFGSTSDMWGYALTEDILTDPTFGVYLQVQGTATSSVSFDVQDITPAFYSTGDYYAVFQLASTPTFNVGDSVIAYGATTATWVNGVPSTVYSISGNFVTTVFDSHPSAYPQTAETGSLYNTVPPYALATTAVTNPFSVGAQVTFASLVGNSWLNGFTAIISEEPTTTTFKAPLAAPYTHDDYANVSDTGIAFIGGTSGTPAARGNYAANGARLFTVIVGNLYEVFSDGSFVSRGNVADDNKPVSMVSSVSQLLIASGGLLYVFNLTTNTMANVPLYDDGSTPIPAISQVDYCDGYFVALLANSQQWQISAIGDATSWDPLDITTVSVFPDNIVSMIVDHREIVLLGARHSVVYYDSGNADFPFDVIPGSFIDEGIAAQFTAVRLDNSVFFVGQDDRGSCMAWRLMNYIPQRISTHAVEFAWSQYSTIADAQAYGYQDQGHSFWVVYFPTANATWVYDVATGLWHERGFWNGASWDAHRSQNHAFCFGKHIVGDYSTGVLYQMAIPQGDGLGGWAYCDDFGNTIVRMRRSPIINNEMEWLYIDAFQLDLEVGLALQSGQGSNPLVMVRYSDDETKTWSDLLTASAGAVGKYKTRVMWRRQGRTRNRCYEVQVSDPVPWRIVAAYLEMRQ